jgi:hypothetical protein
MYRQYTQCYVHSPGDKPFNKADLLGFVAGNAWPGGVGMILAFLSGANVVGFAILSVQTAITIKAVANAWLFHRLVCLPTGDPTPCALGTVLKNPEIGDLGEFDNDQYFSIRLMPHPPLSENATPAQTEDFTDDVVADGHQGTRLLAPMAAPPWDLPYAPKTMPERYALHCEAEGNFWQAMKDYAALVGVVTGVGAGAGAAAGAALGCAIGGLFGFIGCALGAVIGAIVGALAGGGGAAYASATVAFHSDPGNVQDANVGDWPHESIQAGDRVAVVGRHVYDGFHEGWHELHPLMMVMKISEYLEQRPDIGPHDPTPDGLTVDDMRKGLASTNFASRVDALAEAICRGMHLVQDPGLQILQKEPENRWTVHPAIDGCVPEPGKPHIA